MANVNIYLSNKQEIQLKKLAQAEGKSISQFCRERIIDDKEQEEQLNRVSIESEIDELRKSIDIVNKNMMILSKKILQDTQMSSNLVQGFFNVVIEDDETKYNIYKEAEEETKEYMSKIFGK